jgi:predicted aspartyl protease
MMADHSLGLLRQRQENLGMSEHQQSRMFWAPVLAVILFLSCGAAISQASPLERGTLFYQGHQYKEAITQFNAYLSQNGYHAPQSAQALYYRACCLYRMNYLKEAKKAYAQLITYYKQYPEAAMAGTMLQRIDPQQAKLLGAQTYSPPAATPGLSSTASRQMPGQSPAAGSTAATTGPPGSPSTAASTLAAAPAAASDNPSHDSKSEPDNIAGLPDETKVYFKRNADGHMVVDGFVNDRPIKMIFDTGASAHFGVNQLKPLGILIPTTAPTTHTRGWAGRAIPAWKMPLNIRLGGITRKLTVTVQEEDFDLYPLIGQDFMHGYTAEVDDKGGCMLLRKKPRQDAATTTSSLFDIPCRHVGNRDFVRLEVGGRPCQVMIDTGSFTTILNAATASQLGIDTSDAPVRTLVGVGGPVSMYQVSLDLRLGPIRKQDFPVYVGGSAGNAIGQDFLEGWRYTIDQDKQLLRFFH